MIWQQEIKHYWRFHIFKLISIIFIILFLSNCATAPDSIVSEKAKLQYRSRTASDLKNLPEPKTQLVVSVYEFLDKTGQYKSSENGNSYSTAVTQGALVMVLQSLSDSGWFIPIEREGLQNLLKERQLMDISSSGELLTNKSPLLYSDIIIEGGIIAYESNLITGGVGIRYLGTGISNQ